MEHPQQQQHQPDLAPSSMHISYLEQPNIIGLPGNLPQNINPKLPVQQQQIPSKFQKAISYFQKQLKKHCCNLTLTCICNWIVLLCGLLYTNAFGIATNFLTNWPTVNYFSIKVPDQITYNRFMVDNANLDLVMDIPTLNDTEEFLKVNRFLEKARLNMIIGESCIGKSTAFKEYAKN